MICFKFIHSGFLESIQKSKASPSKRSVRNLSPEHSAPCGEVAQRDYCELIKACSVEQDVVGARKLWQEMIAERGEPDGASFSSMVEVLVGSGCTQEAWALANKAWEVP